MYLEIHYLTYFWHNLLLLTYKIARKPSLRILSMIYHLFLHSPQIQWTRYMVVWIFAPDVIHLPDMIYYYWPIILPGNILCGSPWGYVICFKVTSWKQVEMIGRWWCWSDKMLLFHLSTAPDRREADNPHIYRAVLTLVWFDLEVHLSGKHYQMSLR